MSRQPLRAELAKRHIVVGAHNTSCPFFFLLEENLDNLFLLCPFMNNFWAEACGWIGSGVPPYYVSFANSLLDFIDVVGTITKRMVF